MKNKSYKLFFEDILASMEKIERYTDSLSYETFIENEIVIDAVIRNFEIIGEASRNISDDVRSRYADIPWKRMIGLRNIMIHEYSGIDLKVVWDIINIDLPETKIKILEILEHYKEP